MSKTTNMKKVLFFAVAIVACCAFNSCKKTCTCTEKKTGVSQKIDTDSQYRTCSDIQSLFKSTAAGTGQSWTCK